MKRSLNILGISAFYHDSASCLVQDGEILAAAQEERFTRQKHDHRFPQKAIRYCLDFGGIRGSGLDYIIFYEKPLLKLERLLETYLYYAPLGIRSFLQAMTGWIREKLWIPDLIRQETGYRGKILFAGHHESHAASAFFPSPFQRAAFLTLDGVGEWATASFGVGHGNRIEVHSEIHFPHSLGLFYSAFTYYTEFKVNSGEYKVMGLAPYGEPRYVDLILRELIDLKEDGSFRLNMEYFDYPVGFAMINEKFARLFGGPPRTPESEITQKEMDIARSIQAVTEEIMLRLARHIYRATGEKNLCLAGGVALNCVSNGRLLREGPFVDIWIQPAAGDAGGALGAALLAWNQYLDHPRVSDGARDHQKGSFLGPSYPADALQAFLDKRQIPYHQFSYDEIPPRVAELLEQGKVVGWFQGRMEFGPRSLGARSILGDARSPQMQSTINRKIKFRESFRPLAPSVLAESAPEFFTMDRSSPYMLFTADVKREKRRAPTPAEEEMQGLEKRKVVRSDIPAVTHVDCSARLQTVHREMNSLFHRLIGAFEARTGYPVIVNTSLNVRGEPIACSPDDAYACFQRTDMDFLVLENFLLDKKRQPPPENGDGEGRSWQPDGWPRVGRMESKGLGRAPTEDEAKMGTSARGLFIAKKLAPVFNGLHGWARRSVQAIFLIWTKILLSAVFYLLVTPLGFALRIGGKRLLETDPDPAHPSYWVKTKPSVLSKEGYERMF